MAAIDVPAVLLPSYANPGKPGIGEYHRVYKFYVYSVLCSAYFGRMDGDRHFRCAMTQVAPGLKSSWPLHPWVRVQDSAPF
jgi:hypothetical protein